MNDSADLTAHYESLDAGVPVPSVDDSPATKLLPFVLSVTAGSVDTIGFLGLSGLFTAHITGNLVVLAARLVARDQAPLAPLLAVPVFMVALALTRLLAAGLQRIRIGSLLPLLALQLLLLSGFFAVCTAAGPAIDPNSASMIFAGMLGVCAMAVQNALVRISLKGAPTTAVMTTNVTVFTMNVVEILLRRGANGAARARERARHTWPAIAGFLLGCALGAAGQSAFGLRSLALPAGFALLALALGMIAARLDAVKADRA
jgi:uncharacterized membrane protein YoaK (UPF0700 family)